MKKILNLMLVGIAMVSAQMAMAQATFDRQIADVTLLQVKEIKNALKVTEAQRGKMNKHADYYNGLMKTIRAKIDKGQEPSRAEQDKIMAAQRDMRGKVLNELTPTQLTRLREITLQDAGLPALADGLIGKKIGLSTAQTEKIRSFLKTGATKSGKIMKGMEDKLAKEFKNKKPKTDKEKEALKKQFDTRFNSELKKIKPSLMKIEADTRKGIVGSLSVQQRKNWDRLLGKPFSGK